MYNLKRKKLFYLQFILILGFIDWVDPGKEKSPSIPNGLKL